MEQMTLSMRSGVAEKLRRAKQTIAEDVTEEFLRRHPDWLERYGERARTYGIEDAIFHVEFLAGAIEGGPPAGFADYARWTAGMLAARKIEPRFLAENLEQVGAAARRVVSEDEHQLVQRFVRAGASAAAETPDRPDTLASESGLALTQSLFLRAILQGQRRAAANVALEALSAGHSLQDIYVDVFQESLYEVGRRWETNQITVAEEHMATAIVQYVLAQVYERMEAPSAERGRVVLTGVQGEQHQVGANMVADALEADGWDVRFLGANVPHPTILKAIEDHDADVVGISATMLFNVPQVVRLVNDVRSRMGAERPRIILGGAAFRSAPELWKELGADGFAPDVRTAVDLARQWSAAQPEAA
jgi:MerR family transcriptional regulator, light-induced transcriptional regulator